VPVTINNPKQVNIAADGGQQVNVQAKSGEKKNPRRTRQKPKHIIDSHCHQSPSPRSKSAGAQLQREMIVSLRLRE
jgi:hypothetical protein